MVSINEWLPNPIGPDAAGEYVELYNDGTAATDLAGWRLQTENGKSFLIKSGNIPGGSNFVLKRDQTKLSLRNTDGNLSLYNPQGTLVDRASFFGAAPEGKSFSRVKPATGPPAAVGSVSLDFAFADPTPGAPNKVADLALTIHHYQAGVPVHRNALDIPDFFSIMMGTAAAITGLVVYIFWKHEDLSQLFFGRNENIR